MSVFSYCCMQNAIYQRFIYLYDIAAVAHQEFLKNIFPVRYSLLAKLLGTHFSSIL